MLVFSASCVPPMASAGGADTHARAVAVKTPVAPPQHLPGLPWSAPVPGGPFALPAAPPELAALPDPGPDPMAARPFVGVAEDQESSARALDCLTAAVYYEARSESLDGQRAVAQVVLNRVRSPVFPASVCGVVYQGANLATGCQFTFTCDGSLLYRREPESWERARLVARAALAGDVFAPVGTATYYHTTAVSPYWAPSLTRVTQIGAHIFYRWPGAWGNAAAFNQTYAGAEPTPDQASGTLASADGGAGTDDGVTRYAFDSGTVAVHHNMGGSQMAMADTGGGMGGGSFAGVQIHRGGMGGSTSSSAATTMTNSSSMPAPASDPSDDGDSSASAVHVHTGNPPGSAGNEADKAKPVN